MDPKEHLKRKLESHMKSKAEILSPDFNPGEKSVDYWIGLHKGVEFGYKEGITIMETEQGTIEAINALNYRLAQVGRKVDDISNAILKREAPEEETPAKEPKKKPKKECKAPNYIG